MPQVSTAASEYQSILPRNRRETFSQFIMSHAETVLIDNVARLNWVMSGIVLASKIISEEIRRIGLSAYREPTNTVNIQGERQQGLDVFANDVLCECMATRGNVGLVASEENEKPIVLIDDPVLGEYVVVFDPLDGSHNIELNISVGTIFSIFRRTTPGTAATEADILQKGIQQVAAGYVIYGSSTMLVFSMGNGVHGFTLDPTIGTYVLTHPNIRMPQRGSCYAINEAYINEFPPFCRTFVDEMKSGRQLVKYRMRFVGSLVAEFHRTLLQGGIFLYPPTASQPQGRLRLVYEANPIAFLAEQAGGAATNGKDRVLNLRPTHLHQRVPLYFGSIFDMDALTMTINISAANPGRCGFEVSIQEHA